MNLADISDGYAVLLNAVASALAPRPRLDVATWADQYRKLPKKSANESGNWRTDRMPFLRDIMNDLSVHSPTQRVVFMKSSQVGGTECGINWVGYFMMQAKSSMLVIQPTLAMAAKWATQRLDASIDESPEWAAELSPRKSRNRDNQTLQKEGPGFILFVTGANSASSLASMPIKYVFADEVDRYPDDVDDEGDPLGLARRRQKSFPRRKTLIVSTPTIKEASRVEKEYDSTDQRGYFVPCPHCGEMQLLQWKKLQWNVERKAVWMDCEHNGCRIEEHHKPAMLAAGVWIATFPDRPDHGYFINALYTPLGLGDEWRELVFGADGWLAAQGDPKRLKVFVNTVLGESWEARSSAVKANLLQARAEPFKLRAVPVGCLVLTLGVDTQPDRLECQLIGWGRNERCWVLDYFVIHGSPTLQATWDKLTEYRRRPLRNQFGIDMRVMAVAIDSGGHNTHDVYNYVRTWQHERVIAIKGSSTANRAVLGKPTKQDVNWNGQVDKEGVQLWPVGTDTAKSALFERLKSDADVEITRWKVRFSVDLELEYYEQLTAEVFDPERNRWIKRKGKRNEALDTWVYAYAAAQHPDIRIHAAREVEWQQLENMLQPRVHDMFSAPVQQAAETDPAVPAADPAPENIESTPDPASAGFSVSGEADWLGRDDNWLE